MPTGTALVMVDSQYKFIAYLPFYDEMYDNSKWAAPTDRSSGRRKMHKTIDFESMVKDIKRKQMESVLSVGSSGKSTSDSTPFFPAMRHDEDEHQLGMDDIDSLVSRIDAKIAELEAEERAEKEKTSKEKKVSKHIVTILGTDSNRDAVARIVARCKGITISAATNMIKSFPSEISMRKKEDADKLVQELSKCGFIAMLSE